MAVSQLASKQVDVKGVTFAPNNFIAELDHTKLPTDFHFIQDFLATSPIHYALTHPLAVSYECVMQIWRTVQFGEESMSNKMQMTFKYDNTTYTVTPEKVEEALRLPKMGTSPADLISDATLFAMVRQLGYNGEVTKFGTLFRTKLKQEWNFFFDTITRCFMNKTSNFDALPRGSLTIGYSLIFSKSFDFGSFILKSLFERKSDKHGVVCFARFLHLIFNYMCPNVVFESDVTVPIFKITENNIKVLRASDKANGFEGKAFIPAEVRLLLQERMHTQYVLSSDAI